MLIAYLAGLVTLPALGGLPIFLNWAFSKTRAYGKCIACEHLSAREIGDNFNITEWFRFQWHKWFWSKRAWHRQAVAKHRNRSIHF